MSIRYPLALPDTNFIGARLDLRSVVGVHASEFTMMQEVQEHAGQRWEMGLELLARTRANIAAWQAFMMRLRGARGTFVAGDPGATSPLGIVSTDTPTVNGASQAGNELATQGWTPTQTGLLLNSDYVQICRNYLTSPNDLEDAAWTEQTCTADNNTGDVTDPLGTNTATKVTPSGGATNAAMIQHCTTAVAYVPGFRFGGSVWLRAASGTPSILLRVGGDATVGATYKIADLTAALTTSWQKFDWSGTAPAGADRISMSIGGNNTWPEADGAIYIWGASLYALEYDARLHRVTAQFDSDANGRGTLEVVPKLRTIDDHARLIYTSPVGLFRLADNVVGWSESPPVRYTDMAVRAVEAL